LKERVVAAAVVLAKRSLHSPNNSHQTQPSNFKEENLSFFVKKTNFTKIFRRRKIKTLRDPNLQASKPKTIGASIRGTKEKKAKM